MPKAKPRRLPRVAGDERKRKYGQKTEMLAVRVPASLHDAVKQEAELRQEAKSEVVVSLLASALDGRLVNAKDVEQNLVGAALRAALAKHRKLNNAKSKAIVAAVADTLPKSVFE